MNGTKALVIALATMMMTGAADLAHRQRPELQAPRGADVQMPRGQDVQALRP